MNEKTLNKLLDLRFVIGLFFTLTGIVLLVFGLTTDHLTPVQKDINKWGGGVFTAFGILMILISFGKDAHDELLEEEKPESKNVRH